MLSPKAAAFRVEALLRTQDKLTTTNSESRLQEDNKRDLKTNTEKKDNDQQQESPKICNESKTETVMAEEDLISDASPAQCFECCNDQCHRQYSEYSKNDLFEKVASHNRPTYENRTHVRLPIQLPHQEYLQYQFFQRYNVHSASSFNTPNLGGAEPMGNDIQQLHHLQSEQQQKEQKQLQKQLNQQRLSSQNGVTVWLQHAALWDEFDRHQTEMIITKNGRRMFPVIKFRVFGLNPDSLYMIYLDMEQLDGKRYRYAYPSSTWVVAGSGNLDGWEQQVYVHTDSPATGRQWMDMLIISFDKLKLTNNRSRDIKGQIFLQSMQKYKPRIWIQCLQSPKKRNLQGKFTCESELQKLVDRKTSSLFSFPETSFITVTAYQNQRITRLKINSNPFAKGFRENYKNKEVLEKHMITSVSCGMHCQRTPYFPFGTSLSSYFFQHPFSSNHVLPLTVAPSYLRPAVAAAPSNVLRPAASPINRWSAVYASDKTPDAVIPAFIPFVNSSFSE